MYHDLGVCFQCIKIAVMSYMKACVNDTIFVSSVCVREEPHFLVVERDPFVRMELRSSVDGRSGKTSVANNYIIRFKQN
jgi:hypothetical protein